MRRSAAFIAVMLLLGTDALARNQNRVIVASNACQGGTYSAVSVSDGGTLSILFDDFSVTAGPGSDRGVYRRYCNIQVPLNLPEGYSLGVYKVDYRGFARLSSRQRSALSVDYALGHRSNGRRYHRRIEGAYEGDFVFTETLRAGLMKRMGCGSAAVLNVAVVLELQTSRQPEEAMVTLDSIDGAPEGGLLYHFDLRRCGR